MFVAQNIVHALIRAAFAKFMSFKKFIPASYAFLFARLGPVMDSPFRVILPVFVSACRTKTILFFLQSTVSCFLSTKPTWDRLFTHFWEAGCVDIFNLGSLYCLRKQFVFLTTLQIRLELLFVNAGHLRTILIWRKKHYEHRGEAELRTTCDTTNSVKLNEDSGEKTCTKTRMQNQHRNKIYQAMKPKIP